MTTGAAALAAATLVSLTLGCGGDPVGPSAIGDGALTVTGTVSEGLSTPLAGALVELTTGPLAGGVVSTGADGRFSMPAVPAGIVSLRASKPGYSTATASALLTPESNPPFRFSLEPFNPVAVTITGRVTDGAMPVAGAQIILTSPASASTLSDTTGTYHLALSVLPPNRERPSVWWGQVPLLAQKDGYERDERYVTLAARSTADFMLYPTVRLSPGSDARLTINGNGPSCGEVTRALDIDPPTWPCRTIRIVPTAPGRLTLDLEWNDPSVSLGLQVLSRDPWFCCDARQSKRVEPGEVPVQVVLLNERANRPVPSGDVAFRFRTSFTTE